MNANHDDWRDGVADRAVKAAVIWSGSYCVRQWVMWFRLRRFCNSFGLHSSRKSLSHSWKEECLVVDWLTERLFISPSLQISFLSWFRFQVSGHSISLSLSLSLSLDLTSFLSNDEHSLYTFYDYNFFSCFKCSLLLLSSCLHVQHKQVTKYSKKTDAIVLPLLNVTRKQLKLRTEIAFWVQEAAKLDVAQLICKDEVDWTSLKTSMKSPESNIHVPFYYNTIRFIAILINPFIFFDGDDDS